MTVTAIDTHEVVKELKAAGFTDGQAEAVTRVVRRAQDIDLSNLVTKTDLRETEMRLEARIAGATGDLEMKMVSMKADLDAKIMSIKSDLDTRITSIKADLDTKITSIKADLDTKITSIKADLDTKITSIKADLETKIEASKSDLIKWVFGAVGFQTLITIGAVIALARVLSH